jgi:hypothetical protein
VMIFRQGGTLRQICLFFLENWHLNTKFNKI